MLIIIEGPDCAGKTTLADQLQAHIQKLNPNDEVLRLSSGPPTLHPLDEYVVPLLGYRPGSGTHVICDRLHWGEAVYPMIFRRPSTLDAGIFAYIEAFLMARGAIVVHQTVALDELKRRMYDRGDDLVRPDQLDRITDEFFRVEMKSVLPIAVRSGGPIEHVVDIAHTIEQTYVDLNGFTTYVGPRYPRRLLLGDVRGPAFQTDDPIDKLRPAFMPYTSMSGAYLWRALTHEPYGDVGRIGVANACDVDDPVALWTTLGRPQVVTLGKNAARAFKGGHAVPHPQWVRRFHHNRISDYNEVLMSMEAVSWK